MIDHEEWNINRMVEMENRIAKNDAAFLSLWNEKEARIAALEAQLRERDEQIAKAREAMGEAESLLSDPEHDTVSSALSVIRAALAITPDARTGAGDTLSFTSALEIVKRGFDKWASKQHNAKWFRRIDGTPIPNDLCVCIAMEIAASECDEVDEE